MEYDNNSLCYHAWVFNLSDEIKKSVCHANNMSESYFSLGLENMLQQKEWRYFLISLFAVVIVLGFLENILVFIVIVSNKQLHTVTNIFISTLALSDIVICVFSLPFQLHYGITHLWDFGEELCHVIYPLFAIPVFVSTLTILTIAGERFYLIVFPFKPKMTTPMALVIVFLTVCMSICFSMPVILFTELHDVRVVVPEMDVDIHKTFCTESWSSTSANRAYTMFVFVIQFFIPTIAISVLYFKIYRVLGKRPLKQKEKRRKYRTTRILVAITVLFTISWLPFHLFSLLLYFHREDIVHRLGPAYHFTDLLLKIIAMSSACINPFFYGWLNDNFRRELGVMVGKRMKKLRIANSGLTTYHNDNDGQSSSHSEKEEKLDTTV